MFVIKTIKKGATYLAVGCLASLVGCAGAPTTKEVVKNKNPQTKVAAKKSEVVVKKVQVVKTKPKQQPVKKIAQKPKRHVQKAVLKKNNKAQAQRRLAVAKWQREKEAARARYARMAEYRRAAYRQHYDSSSNRLSNAAIGRLRHNVHYDGRYIPIGFPNGDVPANIGVCTDTVIRSYRRLGIDLQRDVYEDISRNFHVYPNLAKWKLTGPDPNIDHRRVHNLKVFFRRRGQSLPITNNPADYKPGDIVTWDLMNGGQNHIGIVVDRRSPADPRRYMIVHNIGEGERMEDMLFKLPITGHFRYFPMNENQRLALR